MTSSVVTATSFDNNNKISSSAFSMTSDSDISWNVNSTKVSITTGNNASTKSTKRHVDNNDDKVKNEHTWMPIIKMKRIN